MNTVTGQEISDYIFTDTFNTDALDKLLLALAEGKKNEVDVFLEALRKAAHESVRVLSGQKEADDKQAEFEHRDYVASVYHAAMM